MKKLTQERLKELLRYDEDTGEFVRIAHLRHPSKNGKKAGGINKAGYIAIHVDGRRYLAQRLAFLYQTGRWPDPEADHENRNRSDNRWSNLREATHSQNNANSPLRKVNTSGYKGVFWDRGKWVAQIRNNGTRLGLGRFVEIEDAAAAYRQKAIEIHGEFVVAS